MSALRIRYFVVEYFSQCVIVAVYPPSKRISESLKGIQDTIVINHPLASHWSAVRHVTGTEGHQPGWPEADQTRTQNQPAPLAMRMASTRLRPPVFMTARDR